jgi:hypothetical protein
VTFSQHPSHKHPLTARSVVRQASGIALRRRTPPITCTACDVIYLTAVPLPAAVTPDHWICGGCLRELLGPDPDPGTPASD